MYENRPNQNYNYSRQPQPAYPPQPYAAPYPQQGAYYGDGDGQFTQGAEAGDISHPAVAAFARKVYTYFATALAAAMAAAFGTTKLAEQFVAQGNTGAVTTLWIGGLVGFFASYLIVVFTRKSHSPLKTALLYVFAGSAGAMLAPLLMYYVAAGMGMLIVYALGVATVTFFGLTVYTLTTGKDFRSLGGILLAGILVMLGLVLIGLFVGFPGVLTTVIMGLGLLVFIGFTLFDTSRVVRDYYHANDAVSAAINLLYDFIMLFRYALYFLGASRD
ncbi:MAG: Bax inhibitor-1 family protein [Planctomycetes bacterium]|jgi:FtsH-binding integral membrane protein|nr:Bax inhibitor-1 family protein [Planctomycetota bacterium]MCL4729345.1 Bax inhibitor-1 family protein [Planctomycetota bacterium]